MSYKPAKTPAEVAGLVVGRKYRIKQYKDGTENTSPHEVGALLKFVRDDGSICPAFEWVNGSNGVGYWYADAVEPVVDGVTIETKQVVVETTIIRVERKLTEAERDAIMSILTQEAV